MPARWRIIRWPRPQPPQSLKQTGGRRATHFACCLLVVVASLAVIVPLTSGNPINYHALNGSNVLRVEATTPRMLLVPAEDTIALPAIHHVTHWTTGPNSFVNDAALSLDATRACVVGRTGHHSHVGGFDFALGCLQLHDNHTAELLWHRRWGTATHDYAGAVALAHDNTLVLTAGSTCGSLPGHTFAGGWADFVLSCVNASSGDLVWERQWGTEHEDSLSAMALTEDSAMAFVAGNSGGAETWPGMSAAGTGGFVLFGVRVSDGVVQWGQQWGTPSRSDSVAALAVSKDGTLVAVGGSTGDSLPGFQHVHHDDAALSCLSASSGELLWVQQWGGRSFDYVHAVAVSSDSSFVAAAGFVETALYDYRPRPHGTVLSLFRALDGGLIHHRHWPRSKELPFALGEIYGLTLMEHDDVAIIATWRWGEFVLSGMTISNGTSLWQSSWPGFWGRAWAAAPDRSVAIAAGSVGGYFSEAFTLAVLAWECPAGTVNGTAPSTCDVCPAGSYTDGPGQAACLPCAAGHSNTRGSTACHPCPVGTIAPGVGAPCTLCPPGSFSNASLLTRCYECPAGFSNTGGATPCEPCGVGMNAPEVGSACTMCPPGTFSNTTTSTDCKTCKAGSYSPGGAIPCQPCPTGSFSNDNAAVCTTCPAGTIANTTGRATCTLCPAGYSNDRNSSLCEPCEPGTYSASLGTSCTMCPTGTYTDVPGSTACSPCPAGTFLGSKGGSTSLNCTECPEGTFSNALGVAVCTACPVGHVSNVTGAMNSTWCSPCPAGTYRSGHASSGFQCRPCGAGWYSGPAAFNCIRCPPGTWSAELQATSAAACVKCPAGTASSIAGTSAATCRQCFAGSWSPPGSSICRHCRVGTYSSAPGAASCTLCPAGHTTNSTWATSPAFCVPCAVGTFAKWDVSEDPSPKIQCQSCGPGTYGSSAAAAACSKCPPGTWSGAVGATGPSACVSCPAGTFQPAQAAGSSQACLPCPAGTYAAEEATHNCTQCPAGTAGVHAGMSSMAEACLPCDSGEDCEQQPGPPRQCEVTSHEALRHCQQMRRRWAWTCSAVELAPYKCQDGFIFNGVECVQKVGPCEP